MKLHQRTIKTAAMFSILLFLVLSITMTLSTAFAVLLFRIGFLDSQHLLRGLFVTPTVSIVIGTILFRLIGKRPLELILEISKATQEVAKGNFNIELNEDIPASEIREMAHNFNVMTRELAGTEILRNDFIENVSHEFKTPLSAIEGYATLLQRKELSEEKRTEYTRRILFNTRRLSTLIGNILLLSRLEHQEIEIQREWFSLDEQLREAILMLEPQWNGKHLELDIDLDPVDCYANRDLLLQIWQNLLGNAIKFVKQAGKIRVLLRKIGTDIQVVIQDDGIGMDQAVLQRIYEKFYQGDTSHKTAGNGLGLSLTKRIVDLHGGKIEASSQVGVGTTFVVTLSALPASDEAH